MAKQKPKTETKQIRVKLTTFAALEEIAQGFETPDEVIVRLFEFYCARHEKANKEGKFHVK